MREERWLPVVGYEGFYEVSDMGRVRSLPRLVRRGRGTQFVRGRILEQIRGCGGYLCVNLYKAGIGHSARVHSLVLEAFNSPRPDGMGCRHLDGNPENNKLANLRWGTQRENREDCVAHGRTTRKLSASDVRLVRARHAGGATIRQLAQEHEVDRATISNVLHGRCYRDV